jgi:hypothetical protein
MKALVGDVSAKVSKEDFLKPKIEDEGLYKMSDDRVVNFASSKMVTAKSTMFPHHNIHKFYLVYASCCACINQ